MNSYLKLTLQHLIGCILLYFLACYFTNVFTVILWTASCFIPVIFFMMYLKTKNNRNYNK